MADKDKTSNVSEQVYQILKDAIIRGYFGPGELITEREVCERLAVSRTPVRDAFRRLVHEKFVKYEPYKGVTVTRFNLEEAKQVYEFRKAVEGFAIESFAENKTAERLVELRENLQRAENVLKSGNLEELYLLDNAFHFGIARNSGNAFVADALSKIIGYISVLRVTAWQSLPERPAITLKEHKMMLEALEKGDKERARAAMISHLDSSWNAAKRVISRQGLEWLADKRINRNHKS